MYKWAMAALCACAVVLGLSGLVYAVNQNATEIAKEKAEAEAPENNAPVDAEAAEAVYKKTCLSCHGGNLEGGAGPSLETVGAKLDRNKIRLKIMNGVSPMMPAFKGQLEDAEIANLAGWLAEHK
ncbi:Cytochrome c551 [Chlamydia abortus]|uniref:C-type cytochrome n=1 Tax=Paenibacillus residui TaxID=629724 RepID=A0ABW3D6M0_9BACL|nr:MULTISPECIES: cytochrome c [Paenibacillaceae]SHE10913.1 Cytochrome c551 [Chlamydia abortus]